MKSLSRRDRENVAKALGAWGEGIEATARVRIGQLDRPEEMPVDTIENISMKILVAFVNRIADLVISTIETMPDWAGTGVQARALAASVLDLIAKESDVLIRNVIQEEVDVERFTRNLMGNPQVVAMAQQFGAGTSTEGVRGYVRPIAQKAAENLRLVIEKAVPVVIDLAREPAVVAALEVQLCRGLQRRPWWRI